MAINRVKKQEIIKELEERITRARSVVFAKYHGIKVNDINALRAEFRKAGSEYVVAKKTLVNRAFSSSDIEGVDTTTLDGEVATIFGYEDEVTPAKIAAHFAKEHEGGMEIIGGVLEKKFIGAAQVKALASLPSKQELYAKVVGSLNAPISGFVNVLAGNLRQLVYVLKAIEEKKS